MAGQLNVTPNLHDFQEAATKYRPQLLYMPIIGCEQTLKHMTPRPGIRYKENVGAISGDAQFGPYKPSRSTDFNLNVDYRTLETFMGSVHCKFEPLIAKGLSSSLDEAIWNAVRNANGDTTKDLFDGFDTITQMEIDADNISEANKNYMKLEEEITTSNALDIAKEILYSLDPRLRAQELNMYCSQDFADKYNEAMLLTHAGINYYNQFGQNTVEGSNGKLHIVPLFNKADSKFIHVTPKSNMLVGFDQMSDIESVMVKEYEPFILSYIATMFFGVQFESIDYRRMKVIELAA